MIKYLGSKRILVPHIVRVAKVSGCKTGLDLFTGTTRVAQGLKKAGMSITANDLASYSRVFSDCYIATDKRSINLKDLEMAIEYLNNMEVGDSGYFTEMFCEKARFFQPKNGRKIDTIRKEIEEGFKGDVLCPVLLTSLIEAADRVDSTCGQQMAFLKKWSKRSFNDLELRVPDLINGDGATLCMDAEKVIDGSEYYDFIYIDPPYNNHSYFANYHIWETLVRMDEPDVYGVVNKRVDAREDVNKSIFNRKKEMPPALFNIIDKANCGVLVVSYNSESWVEPEQIFYAIKNRFEDSLVLSFDYKRYVGAQIGVYNNKGDVAGEVTHLKNKEYLFVGCDREKGEALRNDSTLGNQFVDIMEE